MIYLLVYESKEKWCNLRTTFVRRIKSSTSESKAKKLYCLNEAKQFTLPFIKTCSTLTGNFPPISDEDFETADVRENNHIRIS